MKRLSILALLVLVACASGQPSAREEASAKQPSGKYYAEGLSGLDFSPLDAAGKERALKLLNANGCDCGCKMTLAQCRVEDKQCGRSPVLAQGVIRAVSQGLSDDKIVVWLKAQTAQQASGAAPDPNAPAPPVPKVDIRTDGAPSLGPAKAAVTVTAFEDFQ